MKDKTFKNNKFLKRGKPKVHTKKSIKKPLDSQFEVIEVDDYVRIPKGLLIGRADEVKILDEDLNTFCKNIKSYLEKLLRKHTKRDRAIFTEFKLRKSPIFNPKIKSKSLSHLPSFLEKSFTKNPSKFDRTVSKSSNIAVSKVE